MNVLEDQLACHFPPARLPLITGFRQVGDIEDSKAGN